MNIMRIVIKFGNADVVVVLFNFDYDCIVEFSRNIESFKDQYN